MTKATINAARAPGSKDSGSSPSVTGDTEALLKRGLNAIDQLVDAFLQPLVLVDQRIADQHAGHALVGLRELQQHRDNRADLTQARGFARTDLVDQAEDRRFDELDKALEHLGLAGEVPVKRGFGDAQACRQCRCRDLFTFGVFQHRGKGLQDLQPARSGLART
jgi:hypothetical protein